MSSNVLLYYKIAMQNAINERINLLIEKYSNGNVSAFAKSINQSKQSVNRLFNVDKRSGKYPTPSTRIIESICNAFTEVNYTWLLTGDGSMYKNYDNSNIAKELAVAEEKEVYGTDWEAEAQHWKHEYISIQKKYTALLEGKLEELFSLKRAAGL